MADKTDTLLPNLHQVEKHLSSLGFACTYYKLKRANERRELVERRGGGWTKQSAEQYARAYLQRRPDASPDLDAPALGDPETGEGLSAAERKINSQADMVEVRAIRERMDLHERLGRLVATATVEGELGERMKAFRIGLERFGPEQSGAVAEIFGGSRAPAAELARRLGLEDEQFEQAVTIIMDFCMDRARLFPGFFNKMVDAFLDPFATGRWWTEDMVKIWNQYQANIGQEIPEVDLERRS